MSTFWLKIAAIIVVILVIVVVANKIKTSTQQALHPEKTFSDITETDKERLSADPRASDFEKKPQEQAEAVETEDAEPITLYFKEISEIEQIEAERLLNVAIPGRSMGRLPMTGFNLMIKTCREIMQRWPGSIYDYKARRILGDNIPERYHSRYKITEDDIDLTRFTEAKPGTKEFIMEED